MDDQTLTMDPITGLELQTPTMDLLALAVIWSRSEPERVGEVLLVPSGRPDRTHVFGRGLEAGSSQDPIVSLVRQRPGRIEPTAQLRSPRISRAQLRLEAPSPTTLSVENIGRCPLLHNGLETDRAEVRPGDVLELRHELMFLCVLRPEVLPPSSPGVVVQPFGLVDSIGLVGEAPAMWALRNQIAFVAPRDTHVFIQGASGTGKELVARAVHARSARGSRPLVSRNAATLPETLIDAELFGNARNYPNAGMPERAGLIGEADRSTLFLDEIGELSSNLQAHLLRVLDQGEYQRLGESTMRHANLRLIGATNRPEHYLKHDVLARMRTRLVLPDLNARREDIPLIARHVMRRVAASDPDLARRFLQGTGPAAEPRFAPDLILALVRHRYTTHVRELEALLWKAMAESPGDYLQLRELPQAGPMPEEAATAATPASGPSRLETRIEAPAGPEPGASTPAGVRGEAGTVHRPDLPPPRVSGAALDGARSSNAEVREESPRSGIDPASIPPEVIQECLDRHNGVQNRVWQELGLPSRFVLHRLIKKYDLVVRQDDVADQEMDGEGAELSPHVIQACLDKHAGHQDAVWRELKLSSRFALYRLIRRHGLVVRRR